MSSRAPTSQRFSQRFRDRVAAIVAAVPRGRVITYGEVATLAGSPRAARAVGNLLRGGLGEVPWQRVVNSQRRISFRGDIERASIQRVLLVGEGVHFDASDVIDHEAFLWDRAALPRYLDAPLTTLLPPSDFVDPGSDD